MIIDEVPVVVYGAADSDDGNGAGSRVEVRVFSGGKASFNTAMDDVWRNVQGAMRSAGYHWSDGSLDVWVEEKAREIRAARGEDF